MKPLFLAHYSEIETLPGLKVDPNYEAYLHCEKEGLLRVFTVRQSETAELIGYAVFFVKLNLHFKTVKEAVHDLLFLYPKYRKGALGYRFVKWCDEELKKEGVNIILQSVSFLRDHSSLFKRLGYRLIDLVYVRTF